MNFKEFYLKESVDKDIYSFDGKPGSLGVVNLLDGIIEQWVEYETAENVDWHHSWWVDPNLQKMMEIGEAELFWFYNGELQDFNNKLTPDIKIKIMKQVKRIK